MSTSHRAVTRVGGAIVVVSAAMLLTGCNNSSPATSDSASPSPTRSTQSHSPSVTPSESGSVTAPTPTATPTTHTPTRTPSETASAGGNADVGTLRPSVPPKGTSVDAFCAAAQTFVTQAKAGSGSTTALQSQAQALRGQATELVDEFIDDPASLARIQKCEAQITAAATP